MEKTERTKVYSGTEVVTFPASKTAGALTITGTELYPYEGTASYGNLSLVLAEADKDDVTDTLTIYLYASYDGGTTYYEVATYADLINGSGAEIVAFKDSALVYAPRIRIDAVFDGSGALVAGHGCNVDVMFKEEDVELRREINTGVAGMTATLANNITVTGTSCYIDNTIEPLRKVVVVMYAADTSKITDNVTFKLQSSYDNTYWFDASSSQSDLANGTGDVFAELVVDDVSKLGNYARISISADGTGALISAHGIVGHLILLY